MRAQPSATTLFSAAAVLLTAAIAVLAAVFFGVQLLWAYAVGINAAVFILCGYDKSIAGSAVLRVPEKVLLSAALLGGSAGLLVGMNLWRHKTRKASFQLFLALVLVAQVAIVRWVW